jgi:hypothetical protein
MTAQYPKKQYPILPGPGLVPQDEKPYLDTL